MRLIKNGTLIFLPGFAAVGRSKERAFEQKEKVHKHFPYPDEAIERLARAFYPAILACWNSEEGQREFAAWQAEQAHIATKEKQEVPAGELPALLIVCGFLQGASGWAHPVLVIN
ncbi:transposase [Faecalibacterium taiwanense]|uniref:transposase n=1 Tax=Faecalibacterium taiwanense TaxID=3030638 RepID=UPI003218F402